MTKEKGNITKREEKLWAQIKYQEKAMRRIESALSAMHAHTEFDDVHRSMSEITEAVEEFKRNMRSLET